MVQLKAVSCLHPALMGVLPYRNPAFLTSGVG